MSYASLGDLSQHFLTRNQNVDLRSRLNRLTQEISTGQSADLAARLGRDTDRLTAIDRTLALGDAHARSARATGGMIGTMQVALDRLGPVQSDLASRLSGLPLSGSSTEIANAGAAARAALDQIVGALNTSYGGQSLFSGRGTDGAALATADTMLAALGAVTAGAGDAATLAARVDDWFDAPGGGFETLGYLGDDTGFLSRSLDEGESVTIGIRADDPVLRDMMKAVAIAALAADPATGLTTTDTLTVLGDMGTRLFESQAGTIGLQSTLGLAEARVEESIVRHSARATSLGILRNQMVAADPYETATQLQQIEALLETHYIVTSRLSDLSLARYLR